MANLLDTFIIRFLIQDDGIKKQLTSIQDEVKKTTEAVEESNDTATKGGKAIEESGRKGAEAFASFRREAAGALALFTGGRAIKALIKDTTDANVALGNLSKTLDLPASKLAGYSFLSIANGGKGTEIQGLLAHLQDLTTTVEGRSQLAGLSQSLFGGEVQFTGEDGRLRRDVIEQIHDSKQYQNATPQAQLKINKLLGGSEGTWAALADPRFAEALRQFSRYAPTNAQIQTSREFKRDITDLSGINQKILYDFIEGLQKELSPLAQGLAAIEKENPGAIANGLLAIANVLAIISGIKLAKLAGRAALGAVDAVGTTAALGAEVAIGTLYPSSLGTSDTINGTKFDPRGLSVADQAALFFKSKGYSRAQIGPILGNISAESSFNPHKINPNDNGKGPSVGLFQWGPDRQAEYKKWSGGKDLRDASVIEQLEWAEHELRTSQGKWGRMLRHSANERDAVRSLVGFENPKNPYGAMLDRYDRAVAQRSTVDRAFQDNSRHIGDIHIHTDSNDPYEHARLIRQAIYDPLAGEGGMR